MKMNRLSLIILCVFTALLASCSGGETPPTAMPSVEPPVSTPIDTPDPGAPPTVISPFGTLPPAPSAPPDLGPRPEVTGVDDQPKPGGIGTLVAVGTVNPDLPTGFDKIILVRTGGPADENGQSIQEVIILERSGAISRNGINGVASARATAEISTMIDAINIFAIQANFTGSVPLEGPTAYIYQMQVEIGPSERLLTAQDGFIPEPLEAIIAAVMAEGLKIETP